VGGGSVEGGGSVVGAVVGGSVGGGAVVGGVVGPGWVVRDGSVVVAEARRVVLVARPMVVLDEVAGLNGNPRPWPSPP